MPTAQPNPTESIASRVEGGLLVAVGVAFLASGVAQWFDVLGYRPPAVDFVVAVGLLLWGGSLLWRSERASTDHPTEKRDV